MVAVIHVALCAVLALGAMWLAVLATWTLDRSNRTTDPHGFGLLFIGMPAVVGTLTAGSLVLALAVGVRQRLTTGGDGVLRAADAAVLTAAAVSMSVVSGGTPAWWISAGAVGLAGIGLVGSLVAPSRPRMRWRYRR